MLFFILKINSKYRYVFLLAVLLNVNFECHAQQPGGVSGTRLWLLIAPGKKDSLRDVSGHGRIKALYVDKAKRSINFHPAIQVDAPGWTEQKFKHINLNQGTVVGAFYPLKDAQADNKYLFKTDDNYQVAGMRPNKMDGKAGLVKYAFGSIQNNTTFTVTDQNQGLALKTGIYYAASGKLSHSVWGTDKQLSLLNSFKGYLPELIVYNRVLSPTERWKVESYLAIKYGLTLDTSYINSDGKLIWDLSDSITKKFHYRVCGIARDAKAALLQPTSNTSYEENYPSYQHNSYGIGTENGVTANYIFIPKSDTPSLYRSITIGFSDQSLQSVNNPSYVLWGDNNEPVLPGGKYLSIDSFTNIEMIGRIWMVNNPGKIGNSLRVVLAGQDYRDKKTVFEQIYEPYNYQFYRYLLVKLKSANLKDVDTTAFLLNSYFGREQPKQFSRTQAFNTRTIVWDPVLPDSSSTQSFYSFARVPLLTFWSVGRVPEGIKRYDSLQLYFPYFNDKGIPAETILDTSIRNFEKGDSLKFRISIGVKPIVVKYRESTEQAWKIPGSETAVDSTGGAPPPADNDSTQQTETDVEQVFTGAGNKNFIGRRPWRKKLPTSYYSIGGLEPGKVYIIQLTDKIGQKSTLNVTLLPNQKK